MRLGYADPPYIGQAKIHYGDHPDYAGEVDHVELLRRLDEEFDGWVLHMSAPSIKEIARIMIETNCGLGARWMAWVKPFAAFKRNVSVAYAWEPVLVSYARKPVVSGRITMRDFVEEPEYVNDCVREPITMQRGLSGAKPEAVCRWAFEMMGAEPDDELVDLFPGTGAVMRAWERWRGDTADQGAQEVLAL